MRENEIKAKTIVIVATLDTRGDEVQFLKDTMEGWNYRVVTIDTGVVGNSLMVADFPKEKVAGQGGKKLAQVISEANAGADRKAATDVMIQGAKKIVWDLFSTGRMHAIMSLGGTTAAASAVSIMKGLPIGFPKLLITTFLTVTPVGKEDITVMQSPVDLVGLNKIISKTLFNAAGAITGMIEHELPVSIAKKLAGITGLGATTPAVQNTISMLNSRGYDSIVFHATSSRLNEMALIGSIDAVLDITPFEAIQKVCYSDALIQKLYGSTKPRRTRLGCTSVKNIPMIIAPGGLDMHIIPNATGIDAVPIELQGRAWTMHGPNVVVVRTNKEELLRVGKAMAEISNRALGPVFIVIPLRGFSEADREGAPLYDPDADSGFIEGLKNMLNNNVRVKEVNCHINDVQFADAVAEAFDEIVNIVR